jgi:dienelactone hydrolase
MTSTTALLIAHEIWGVNGHIAAVADHFRATTGHEVVAPSYLPEGMLTGEDPEEVAYRSFMESLGIDGMAAQLAAAAEQLHQDYTQVYCLGFSVGATATWIAARSGHLDAAVCIYGSRIRDHLTPGPLARTLVVMAEEEASFRPRDLLPQLAASPHVTAMVVDGTAHGYCNPVHLRYNAAAAEHTYAIVTGFLRGAQ